MFAFGRKSRGHPKLEFALPVNADNIAGIAWRQLRRDLMADVFISYKSERRKAARHLEQILIRHGYSVWFDHALTRGEDYEAQIQREISAAKALVRGLPRCMASASSRATTARAALKDLSILAAT